MKAKSICFLVNKTKKSVTELSGKKYTFLFSVFRRLSKFACVTNLPAKKSPVAWVQWALVYFCEQTQL